MRSNHIYNKNTINSSLKILVVCSGNTGDASPFVQEQVEAISNLKVEIDFISFVLNII